ncbi:MAG: SUMF1/EgtB/PvdO family nonheme iron enzyme [Anaerolineales bacterium]|nr:SUMF1/EgtB/PvdO family nonheme iron enzyme [Anaerolineales bacterium]
MTNNRQPHKPHSFDWRQSPAHYWLLTTFLQPRRPDPDHLNVNWAAALGEEPEAACTRFLVQGVLTRAPLTVQAEAHYRKTELQALLREQGLSSAGNKAELIDRLIQHDELALRLRTPMEMLHCTDYGRSLAEAYLTDRETLFRQIDADGVAEAADEVEEASAGERTESRLTPAEMKRLLRWVLREGIVLGIAGNAAYDLLKALAERLGERLPDWEQLSAGRAGVGLDLEWRLVPAGYFLMGYDRRRVYVGRFAISRYPITNEQYRQFVRATRYEAPRHWSAGRIPAGKERHPVVYVSHADAVAFCGWLSRAKRLEIDLPTETEWEKAARGTDGREYPWGDWREGRCNIWETGIKGTTPVDHYPNGCSPYGVCDMAGNVWEWTNSWYSEGEIRRALRGGSWFNNAGDARAAGRSGSTPVSRDNNVGFRVVLRRPPSQKEP